jgi:hypothetical protein
MNETTNSPWPAPMSPEEARAAAAAKRKKHDRRLVIGIVAGAVVLTASMGWTALQNNREDNEPQRMMSLTEAACQMLNEGKTPEFTYSVAKDLASQYPLTYGEDESIAARAAVSRAQAQGCG